MKFDLDGGEREKSQEMALDGVDLKGEGNSRKKMGRKSKGWHPFLQPLCNSLSLYSTLQLFHPSLKFFNSLINQPIVHWSYYLYQMNL